MEYISHLTTSKKAWLFLTLVALSLELCALFFQYALDLKPCIMCVYQRLALSTILLAGLIGVVGHQYIATRLMAYVLWGTGAIWGLLLAIEHVEMQSNSGSLYFSCELIPNFPNWAPLHQWIPFLFEATGDCGEISWQLLTYSMPQWMILVYAVFTVTFIIALLTRLLIAKRL